MNVADLIAELQKLPQDAKVILSRDPEGNGYHWLEGVETGTVEPSDIDNWHVEQYYSDAHSDDDCCLEPGERADYPKIICLWP